MYAVKILLPFLLQQSLHEKARSILCLSLLDEANLEGFTDSSTSALAVSVQERRFSRPNGRGKSTS